jgi:SAM-dependent methyltransferase
MLLPISHYQRLRVHRGMMRDRVRTEFYHQAISERVNPGDVVLDFGAGSGILSIFAAKAGARKVYAVERTSIAEIAREIIHHNRLDDRIELICGDIETVELPEQVDVIVSEWMGAYGVDENMLAPLLVARDRYLKPGGIMLPEQVTAWIAPTWDDRRDHELNFWRNKPYDLDLSLISDYTAHEVFFCEQNISEDTLLAAAQPLWTTDVYNYSLDDAKSPFQASLSFSANRAGKLVSLAAWFTAEFGQGLTLTNAPDAPKTHWGQSVFPLNCPIEVEPGVEIAIKFSCEPAGPGCCHNTWSVRVGDKPWEHHDSRKAIL